LLQILDEKVFATRFVLQQSVLECKYQSWQAKLALQNRDRIRSEYERHKAQSGAQVTELQQSVADLKRELAGTSSRV
jgi:hypothetical protein